MAEILRQYARYSISILLFFGFFTFAHASTYNINIPVDSDGYMLHSFSDVFGVASTTNISTYGYTNPYPDVSVAPCAAVSFPISAFDTAYTGHFYNLTYLARNTAISCDQIPPDGEHWVKIHRYDTGDDYIWRFTVTSGVPEGITVNEDMTRFTSLVPTNASTTATTTTIGATVYANNADFSNAGRLLVTMQKENYYKCAYSGYGWDESCKDTKNLQETYSIYFNGQLERLVSGLYNLSTTTTFVAGGVWDVEYDIQQASTPWYYLGLNTTYNTIVSTTTRITVGQPSAIDLQVQQFDAASAAQASSTRGSIGRSLASTTLEVKDACTPFSTGFNAGDCLVAIAWPGSKAFAEDFTVIAQTPPWGYVYRLISILNATTSSTTLPTIHYQMATTSPLGNINIDFDPFGQIKAAGGIINSIKSNTANPETVWDMTMPVIRLFMYLVLFFQIMHDLTGIHSHARDSSDKIQ